MPDLQGSELAGELRSIRTGVLVLLMSGYGGPQFAERAAAAGVSEVLSKPLQIPPPASPLGSVASPGARDDCIDLRLRRLHGFIDTIVIVPRERLRCFARLARCLEYFLLQQRHT